MSNITQVTLTSGIPSGPSGAATVSTLDALMADGGQATIGSKADAAVSNPASSGSTVALLKGLLTLLAGTLTVATHAVTQSGSWVLSAGSALIGVVKIGDGTNSAAIKAASTAPVATDPAVVVAISPNGQNTNGRKTPANSAPVVEASRTYATVAASQTAQILGTTGAAGDMLDAIWIIPGTTSPGAVNILDSSTSISVFAGGASSVGSLVPFPIYLGAISANGAWKVTTGANVTVIAVGNFT